MNSYLVLILFIQPTSFDIDNPVILVYHSTFSFYDKSIFFLFS